MKDVISLPRISIVTPSFNQADYIEEAIQSVLCQNYPNLEYLIFDGGSKDGTLERIMKYEGSLKWVSQPDKGQSDAINRGFRQATGDILAFLNSDDRYEPEAFFIVGKFFANHPEAHWLTGRCKVINRAGQEIRRLVTAYKNFWLSWKSRRVLLVLDYISQPATFWRRSVVEKIGLFDEKLDYSMDYDYSLRVSKYYRLWTLNQYLAAYRIHPASKSGSVRKHFEADLAIAHRYSNSSILMELHRIHNNIIMAFYERWQAPVKMSNK